MSYKESINEVRDTEFGIEVRKLWKDRLREINTILFEAKQAESEAETKMYLDQLPQNFEEMTMWLFDKVMRNHDTSKLTFIQGAFVGAECEEFSTKMNDLLRDKAKGAFNNANQIPEELRAVLGEIIRRRNND